MRLRNGLVVTLSDGTQVQFIDDYLDATGQKFVSYMHEIDVSGSLIVVRHLLDWNSERYVVETEETVAHYSAHEFLSLEITKIPDSAEELRFFGVPSEDINRLFMAVNPLVRDNETLSFLAKVISSGKKVILVFTSERIFTLDAKSFSNYKDLFNIERIRSAKSGSFKSIELSVSGKFLGYVFACPDKAVVSELTAAINAWIPEQIIDPVVEIDGNNEPLIDPESEAVGEVSTEPVAECEELEIEQDSTARAWIPEQIIDPVVEIDGNDEPLIDPESEAVGEVSTEPVAEYEELEIEQHSAATGSRTAPSEILSINILAQPDSDEIVSPTAVISASPEEGFLRRAFARMAVILFGARKARRLIKRLKNEIWELNSKIEVRESYVNLAADLLARDTLGASYEGDLLDVGNCELIEVRKGARVTVRESSYSSSGGGVGVRIGRVGVGGGSSSGSSTSTTTSYPAPDILKTIDYGKLKITNRKISFVGSKFTKTCKFPNVVDVQVKGSQLLIAPTTGSKVWICEFPNQATLVLAACLMLSSISSRNRTLDSKCESDFSNASELVRAHASNLLDELTIELRTHQLLIDEHLAQLDSLNTKYRGRLAGKVLHAQEVGSEIQAIDQLEIA